MTTENPSSLGRAEIGAHLQGTRVGVVGAGTMGIGIAYVFALAGARVIVAEPDRENRRRAGERLLELTETGIARGRLDQAAAQRVQTVILVDDLDLIPSGATVIVEAVPEEPRLKQSVLAACESRDPKVLATNTSSLAITSLTGRLRRPQRLVGMHFFNPVWATDLVEVVRGEATGSDTVDAAVALATGLGKTAIVVADRPGFASSRLGVLLGLEAIRMLEEGVASAADIDTAMTLGYRHPMGPLRLTDLVGLDVRLAIAENLADAYGPRFQPPQMLRDLVAAGRLGRKSGQGFFEWTS